MALPVAFALSGVQASSSGSSYPGAEQAELYRRNLLSLLKVEVVDPQQSNKQTPSHRRELNSRKPNQRALKESSKYWSLLNQIDNISLQKPCPLTVGHSIISEPVSSDTPTHPEIVPDWSEDIFTNSDSPVLFTWNMNSRSTYIPLEHSMAVPIRTASPPTSREMESTNELMDYEYTYLPSTSTPWSTTQPALIENTTARMQNSSPLTSSTNSLSRTRATRRSRSTSPPSPTRSRSPYRTSNRPRRSFSTPTNISLTNILPIESKRQISRRNVREEPVIMHQNRDLLDLRNNLQPPAFHVSADVFIEQVRSSNATQEPAVEQIVTCTEDDCNFVYVFCDIDE